MKKAIVMSSIVLCAAAGSFAEAGLSFQALDANADGFISPEEAITEGAVADQFGALDADQNNLLSEAEFSNLTETVK